MNSETFLVCLFIAITTNIIRITNRKVKYKLVQKNFYTDYKVISKPQIINKQDNVYNNQIVSEEMNNIINKVYSVLEPEVSKESMQIIENNLNNIKEKSSYLKSIKLSLIGGGGKYSPIGHTISKNYFLTKKDMIIKGKQVESKKLLQKILSHELIHAASSHKNKNKIIVGFNQCNMLRPNSSNIGRGINEGYTDYISNKYIVDKNLNIKGVDVGYNYEVIIAQIIELIVGKEKMINMFFQGDLEGLIKELSKYQDELKVKQFILDLDTISFAKSNVVSKNDKELITTLYNRINIFLYKAFSNKTEEQVNKDVLDDYLKDSKKYLQLFSELDKINLIRKKTKKEIKK